MWHGWVLGVKLVLVGLCLVFWGTAWCVGVNPGIITWGRSVNRFGSMVYTRSVVMMCWPVIWSHVLSVVPMRSRLSTKLLVQH